MTLPTKANVSRPLSEGYGALIEYGDTDAESLYLPLAIGPNQPLQFQPVEPRDEGPDLAANPEDLRSESGESFSRSAFSGGEGLDRAHRRNSTERDWSRYWDSRNIDVTPARAGEAEEIKLLHSTSSLRSMAAGADRGALVRVGTVLYGIVNSATQVDRTANPTASSPTWSQESPGGSGDIADLTALGDQVYAARDTIRVRSSGGSWSQFTNVDAARLWSAKGRVLASTGAALYEARSGTDNSVLLHTLDSGETWTDVVDAGAAILAAASDGLVYSFAEQNGELTLRNQSRLFGETPTALGFTQGLVFVGTGEDTTAGGKIGRLYRGVLVGLRLRELQVLREWGDGSETRDRSPKRVVGTRESAWTAVIEDGSETHMWRYHLETGGVSRDLILGASGVVHGIAVFDDRMFASVFGSALYRENTTYADSGWLIGPLADFYSAAPKAWVGARLNVEDRPADTTVVLAYTTDPDAIEDDGDASWTSIITFDNTTSPTGTESAITEVESRYIAAKVTLTANGANTATPRVLAYEFRGLADVTEHDYGIPVNLSDRIETPSLRALLSPGRGAAIHSKIRELEGQAATVTILRPAETVKGQIRGLVTSVRGIPDKGSVFDYGQLIVRGQRQ